MPGKHDGMINVHVVDKKCSFYTNVTDATGVNSQPVLFIMIRKPFVVTNSFQKHNIVFTTK